VNYQVNARIAANITLIVFAYIIAVIVILLCFLASAMPSSALFATQLKSMNPVSVMIAKIPTNQISPAKSFINRLSYPKTVHLNGYRIRTGLFLIPSPTLPMK
jgi:hypothetical protein